MKKHFEEKTMSKLMVVWMAVALWGAAGVGQAGGGKAKKPKCECADFSGSWTGTCQGNLTEHKIKIQQDQCEYISMLYNEWELKSPIGGTYSTSEFEDGAQIVDSTRWSWNAEATKLNLDNELRFTYPTSDFDSEARHWSLRFDDTNLVIKQWKHNAWRFDGEYEDESFGDICTFSKK